MNVAVPASLIPLITNLPPDAVESLRTSIGATKVADSPSSVRLLVVFPGGTGGNGVNVSMLLGAESPTAFQATQYHRWVCVTSRSNVTLVTVTCVQSVNGAVPTERNIL